MDLSRFLPRIIVPCLIQQKILNRSDPDALADALADPHALADLLTQGVPLEDVQYLAGMRNRERLAFTTGVRRRRRGTLSSGFRFDDSLSLLELVLW